MISKLFKNFYFITKLTTTFVLFITVLFLGYVLIKSYRLDNREEYTTNIDQNIKILTTLINDYSQELDLINQKITNNEKSLNKISQIIDDKFISNELDKLPNQFNILLKENQNLQKEINNLTNLFQLSNSKKRIDSYDLNTKDNNLSSLINLIELKYESGADIEEELMSLQKQNSDESKNAYLEKLFILSDQKFIGMINLQNQFDELMKKHLNNYYNKKNDNIFFSYFANFFYIEPNYKSNFENETLKRFSIIKNKLQNKDVESSLTYLSMIDDNDHYFKKWMQQAKNCVDFKKNLKIFYNN